jgi:N-methylhydantoinase A
MRIGIDSGGTFTDFIVLHASGRLESFKLRSNPADPASVILAGLSRIAAAKKSEVIHGSTVATNAVLERKGARTAFVTTAGFEDIIHIGRQNRAELYNLTPLPRKPLVSGVFGVKERTWHDGTIALRPSGLASLKKSLREGGFESIAICLLHAYRNAENERAVAAAIGAKVYLCASHEICPEFREYERASTTVMNAYVGPLMDRYLAELEQRSPHPISIMQSNGGLMSAAEARRHAVRTVLSGPAGGVVGAFEMARHSGYPRVLGFDMGGTSTDVSLCDGRPRETAESQVDGFPIRVPMLDIHTVGAGGGSIARIDAGGLLRVGPESAGADPGPACYGKGELPAVTDAHVVLGRIAADQLAGGEMHMDVERSGAAVDTLGLERIAGAAGILRVANANMERAIRAVSIERGYDPRAFALLAFGGCGGLHACEIAADLGIRRVLVPEFAGALSALGMLMADRVRDYAAGVLGRTDAEERFRALEKQAGQELPGAKLERLADYRYEGQSYELTIPWKADFHAEHQRVYGYSDKSRKVEAVTIRVHAVKKVAKPAFQRSARVAGKPQFRRIYVAGRWRRVPVYTREQLPVKPVTGPALVTDYGSTTLVPPGWKLKIDRIGTLIVER